MVSVNKPLIWLEIFLTPNFGQVRGRSWTNIGIFLRFSLHYTIHFFGVIKNDSHFFGVIIPLWAIHTYIYIYIYILVLYIYCISLISYMYGTLMILSSTSLVFTHQTLETMGSRAQDCVVLGHWCQALLLRGRSAIGLVQGPPRYPLVNFYIAMERSTIFNGKIHYKSPFSIAMLNYQRVLFFCRF